MSVPVSPMEPEETRVGSRIGRYAITHRLGRGTGGVFAANDLELGRTVALKFLGGASTCDRLIREAKAASALNHPNIVTVHDLVHQGADTALAMELVEGKSLREYCEGDPQPIREVVRWGRQIAQALAATHANGIVHRDIKPENVIVRPDGYVKVVDFGLSLPERLPASTSRAANGSSYLSPEQSRGERGNAASDIFSLGTVLYELLCGVRPFQSPSALDTAHPIADAELKPPQSLRAEVSDSLNSLIQEMLATDPALRPRAQEVEYRLAAFESSTSSVARMKIRKKTPQRWWIAAVAASTIAAGVALIAFWPKASPTIPATGGVIRYSIPMPPGTYATQVAISRRGDQIAYAAGSEQGNHIYRRYLDSTNSRPLPGSEHAEEAFFSPDGEEVAFFIQKGIRIAGPSGYRDIPLGMVPTREHGYWTSGGWIYFDCVKDDFTDIYRVRPTGGTPELVLPSLRTTPLATERRIRQVLPEGILYGVRVSERPSLEWMEFKDRSTHKLIDHADGGEILPTGHLLYFLNNSLFAAPFDLKRRQVSGSPIEVVGGVRDSLIGIGGMAALSDNGTLVSLRMPDLPKRKIYWRTLSGSESEIHLPAATYEQVEISPDGQRLVFVQQTDRTRWSLCVFDIRHQTTTTLYEGKSPYMRAIWSPDSKTVVAGIVPDGQQLSNLFLLPVDAPGKMERLTNQPLFLQAPTSWSAGANAILFLEGPHANSDIDTMLLPLDTRQPRQLVGVKGADRCPSFSPDGRWFVYASDFEDSVFLQDVGQTGPPRRVSQHGGRNTLWSPRGDRIYYQERGAYLMEVTVDSQGHTGTPHEVMVTNLPGFADATSRGYAIALDGRFVMLHDVPGQHPPGTEIDVVINWFHELKRLVPVE